MRAGDHPEAAIVDGGVVEGDPGGAERAVAGRDEVLVLVPRLSGFAGMLDEQHRLHALDVGADRPGQHLDDAWMGERLAHQRRELVREVDRQEAGHVVGVAAGGIGAGQFRCLVAAEAHRLVDERGDLGRRDGAARDAEATSRYAAASRSGLSFTCEHRFGHSDQR